MNPEDAPRRGSPSRRGRVTVLIAALGWGCASEGKPASTEGSDVSGGGEDPAEGSGSEAGTTGIGTEGTGEPSACLCFDVAGERSWCERTWDCIQTVCAEAWEAGQVDGDLRSYNGCASTCFRLSFLGQAAFEGQVPATGVAAACLAERPDCEEREQQCEDEPIQPDAPAPDACIVGQDPEASDCERASQCYRECLAEDRVCAWCFALHRLDDETAAQALEVAHCDLEAPSIACARAIASCHGDPETPFCVPEAG